MSFRFASSILSMIYLGLTPCEREPLVTVRLVALELLRMLLNNLRRPILGLEDLNRHI